jgi:hypothetical protein
MHNNEYLFSIINELTFGFEPPATRGFRPRMEHEKLKGAYCSSASTSEIRQILALKTNLASNAMRSKLASLAV